MEPEKITPSPFPSCDIFHDRFVSCLRPMRQVSHIYKHAVAENCGEFVDDWQLCMKAKLEKDENKIAVRYFIARIPWCSRVLPTTTSVLNQRFIYAGYV